MEAPGKLVPVNDTIMHVFNISKSSARTQGTILFLSGSGTECPTYDFKPLWHLLEDQYPMAVVERPGYGWSGQTNQPRSIDTILEETRAALKQAHRDYFSDNAHVRFLDLSCGHYIHREEPEKRQLRCRVLWSNIRAYNVD